MSNSSRRCSSLRTMLSIQKKLATRQPRVTGHERIDIVEAAGRLGLSLVYVPSMRNGSDTDEDRGNAILSTEPLSDVAAVELPFERQRRVAIDAAVSVTGQGLAGIVAAAARAQQALGHGRRTCLPAEAMNQIPSRRGLYAARDPRPGDIVEAADLVALRPREGICASEWQSMIGVRIARWVTALRRW